MNKIFRPYFAILILLNVAAIIGAITGVIELRYMAMFFWAECSLAGLLAVAMYARYLIVFFLLSGAMGFVLYIANPALFSIPEPVILFWSLYSVCWLVYIEVGKSAYGRTMRSNKPGQQLSLYAGYMGGAILVCFFLTTSILPPPESGRSLTFYKTFACVAILVPSISIGLLKMIDMIGQKHFIDFLLGTYLYPQEKNYIVLFLDMVGSSTIAEKLEPKQSMDLISKFIYDCGYVFRIYGGDILNYTGDGLVVLWPRKQSNSALAAVTHLQNHFASKQIKLKYWKKFGLVPSFRMGLHAGPVVISQIGEEKLFIGLYGDVVNTAARLEQMNKSLGTEVLLSSEVIYGLNQSWKALLKPLGEKEVRGRDEKVKVFTIYKQT